LIIIDREYRIIKFNDAYTRTRGKSPSDLSGKKCYEALQNRDLVCRECVVDRTFQSKDPCAKEKQLMLPDGSLSWIEIYTYPIFDQSRNVTHVVEYARDITDRKKEEEEKKSLIRNLSRLSMTDGLTGLLNRRALNDMLKHEIDRSTRYNADLSLLLCDVDKFKGINDTFGHTAGDRVLQAVSEALKGALRKADILGRYGGDEFMIILPETGLSGARSLAEKIRIAVNELDFELPGNDRRRLSISIGVASCCTPGDDIDTLLALADSALYSSKEAGETGSL
jgi:diguanylate cyclase (GGDEF)-like protein/PAS domain S-box-containing protein